MSNPLNFTIRILLAIIVLFSFAGSASAAGGEETTVWASQVQLFEPAPQAPNGAAYYDGRIQYSTITNCVSIIQGLPYSEYGVGAYVGFAADPAAAQPAVGQKYYIHIVVAGMGNSCAGQRAWLEFALPASTSLAIDGANPIRCYFDNAALGLNECPQTLINSPYHNGAYAYPSVDSAHANTWPMPQGHFIEIQIPVVSSVTLTNAQLVGYILALDGNSNSWLQPSQGVYVFSNTPAVLYPSASTERLGSPVTGYKSTAWVYTHGLGGNVYFDLGTTTAYGLFTDGPAVIPAGGSGYSAYTDWTPYSLQPNTTYHWRARFIPTAGSPTYFGADQTFTTAANGQVKMGTGTAASCTPAALTAALATPGILVLTFDCGAAPVTLNLTNAWAVASNFTIDGSNKITLQGNNTFRLFDVYNGGTLNLNNVDLTGGSVNGCGGGIHVSAGGTLNATNVRLTNNQSLQTGGGLCVEAGGTAVVTGLLVSGSSAAGHGGGIFNAGMLDMMWSDVSGNTSGANGGGIYNTGSAYLLYSLVSGNNAPTDQTRSGSPTVGGGGGIYNTGSLSLSTGTVANNTASFGGGVLNDGGSAWLTGVTIAANQATAGGKPLFFSAQAGGLESALGGSVNVRNTLIAGNLVLSQFGGMTEANCGTSPSKTIVSLGSNLDGGSQCLFTQPSDQQNANPRLGTLANNGGRTRTISLRRGSPAIDHADNVYCGMYDQRGFVGITPPNDPVMRQLDGNNDGTATCDIGAFEYRPVVYIPGMFR